jgi:hypothetical protein
MKAERQYVGIDSGKRTYTMAEIGLDGKVRFTNGKTAGMQGNLRGPRGAAFPGQAV